MSVRLSPLKSPVTTRTPLVAAQPAKAPTGGFSIVKPLALDSATGAVAPACCLPDKTDVSPAITVEVASDDLHAAGCRPAREITDRPVLDRKTDLTVRLSAESQAHTKGGANQKGKTHSL